jgi:hypothetical protein
MKKTTLFFALLLSLSSVYALTTVNANYSATSLGTTPYVGSVWYAWPAVGNYYASTGTVLNTATNTTAIKNVITGAQTKMIMMDVDGSCIHPTRTTWALDAPSYLCNMSALQEAAQWYTDNNIAIGLIYVFTPYYMRNITKNCAAQEWSNKTCQPNSTTEYGAYILDAARNISNGNTSVLNNVKLIQYMVECYGDGFCERNQTNRTIVARKNADDFLAIQPIVKAGLPNTDFCMGNFYRGTTNGTTWTNDFLTATGMSNSTMGAMCPHRYSQENNYANLLLDLQNYSSLGYTNTSIWVTEYGTTDDALNLNEYTSAYLTARTPLLASLYWGSRFKAAIRFQGTGPYNESATVTDEGYQFHLYSQPERKLYGAYNGTKFLGTTLAQGNTIKNTTISAAQNLTCALTTISTNKYLTCINDNTFPLTINVTLDQNNYTNVTDLIRGTTFNTASNYFNTTIAGYDDTGGNGGILSLQLTQYTDYAAPVITVTSPTNSTYTGTTNVTNISVSFSATDESSISTKWFDNGSANITYTAVTNLSVVIGSHRIIFYANDTNNNIATTTVYYSIENSENVVDANLSNMCLNGSLTFDEMSGWLSTIALVIGAAAVIGIINAFKGGFSGFGIPEFDLPTLATSLVFVAIIIAISATVIQSALC